MSLLRRRMMMQKRIKAAKYPLADGTYPLNQYGDEYQIKNGIVYIPDTSYARFCLTTPTIAYDPNCVNNESWIIPANSTILFEIDNTCGLTWYFRSTNNSNIRLNDSIGHEYTLTSDVKNIFALGTSVEGTTAITLYVNGERWI